MWPKTDLKRTKKEQKRLFLHKLKKIEATKVKRLFVGYFIVIRAGLPILPS